MRKLQSRRGETLVETLVTILIVALSAGLLVVMAATAVRMGQSADEKAEAYYKELAAAEAASGTRSGTAVIGGDLENTGQVSVPIRITGEDDELRAYRKDG